MGTLLGVVGRVIPFAIIAGLLVAALLIEPKATGLFLPESLIGPRDRFYGVATADENVIWLAGNDGKILRSDDGSTSWRAQNSATNLHIQDIAAWNRDRAIAVGNGGLILVTDNGGAAWRRVEPKIDGLFLDKLLRVNTRDGGRVYAVGEFGAVLASDDYGRNWRLTTEQRDVGLNDIAFASDSAAWVVGEFGTILKSVDGGENWSEVESPTELSLNAVAFRTEKTGVAVGLNGTVLVTRDAGESWTELATGTREHLFDVVWIEDAWFAAGDKGVFATGTVEGGVRIYKPGEIDHFWHTDIEIRNGVIYAAGGSVGTLHETSWQPFSG